MGEAVVLIELYVIKISKVLILDVVLASLDTVVDFVKLILLEAVLLDKAVIEDEEVFDEEGTDKALVPRYVTVRPVSKEGVDALGFVVFDIIVKVVELVIEEACEV